VLRVFRSALKGNFNFGEFFSDKVGHGDDKNNIDSYEASFNKTKKEKHVFFHLLIRKILENT
jgi:hypothetical protein